MDGEAPTPDQELAQKGSFVRHIDLLSDMFEALQNGTGQTLDIVAHCHTLAERQSRSPDATNYAYNVVEPDTMHNPQFTTEQDGMPS